MKIHLVDGTYELFRSYYALPSIYAPDGMNVGAVRGLLQSLLRLIREENVTHIACAFDSVVESFRNEMFDGYKTGDNIPQDILDQFPIAESIVASLGITIWPMVDFEADDAIASAVALWSDAAEVEQIIVCSPDKDLAQIVEGDRIILFDRKAGKFLNENAVVEKFGVYPLSIPDYLALVGDVADGIPGIPRWGVKSASSIIRVFHTIENIPVDGESWGVPVRGLNSLSRNLEERREEVMLYKNLATLRRDVDLGTTLDDLEWRGVQRGKYQQICQLLGFDSLLDLPHEWNNEELL